MKVEIVGNQDDLGMIIISAERYALGRRTYVVQWTCEFIKNNLKLLSHKDKQVMIKDIKNAYYYGDSCDKYEWMKLLKILESEIENEAKS